jgi:hypothetical protein
MSLNIINPSLAKQVVEKNLSELKAIHSLLDSQHNSQDYQQNPDYPPVIADFSSRHSNQQIITMPEKERKELLGTSNVERVWSSNTPTNGILPIIFIVKTISEWSNDESHSELVHIAGTNEHDFTVEKSGILELILIRNAFAHTGNRLSFTKVKGYGNYKLLNYKSGFNGKLNITGLADGDDLIKCSFNTYLKLFNKVISELASLV